MSSKTIIIIDSGIGGLSICQPIVEQLPELNIHYVSDNDAFPYGTKDSKFLKQRVPELLEKLLDEPLLREQTNPASQIDATIIACNTASTVVLPTLREQYSFPIIGVVPAIKTASNTTQSGHYALLATPGTVERDYTNELINNFSFDQKVEKIGSRELVDLIEIYFRNAELDSESLNRCLQPLLNHPNADHFDCVVLGCTHFPLIKNSLEELAPNWQWIDSGPAIASRLVKLLELNNQNEAEIAANATIAKKYFWATSDSEKNAYNWEGPFAKLLENLGFSGGIKRLNL